MPYRAKAVANEFLYLAKNENKQLSQMQLQKLVYFAYGWFLAITGERLIDERVEAWQWGPVVPSVYSEFRKFGSDPITGFAADPLGVPYRVRSTDASKDARALLIIQRVWQLYGNFTASQLSGMTHEPNSPWAKTAEKEIKGTDIDDKVIEKYFRQLAATYDQQRTYARS